MLTAIKSKCGWCVILIFQQTEKYSPKEMIGNKKKSILVPILSFNAIFNVHYQNFLLLFTFALNKNLQYGSIHKWRHASKGWEFTLLRHYLRKCLKKILILVWQGKGGPKILKFVWRHLWMVAKIEKVGKKER